MRLNHYFFCLLFLSVLCSCSTGDDLTAYGQAYQETGAFAPLQKVVELLPPGSDTARVKALLGQPIDMGFDYRYLVDSTGPNGCVVGAVFHIDENGQIDQQWTGEICE